MKRRSTGDARRSLLLTLFVLAIATAVVILPTQFRSSASSKTGQGLIEQTTVDEGIPDFDVRTSKADAHAILEFRRAAGNAVATADLRDGFVRGEETLRGSLPTLKVEYSQISRVPELIAPDPLQGAAVMSSATHDRVGALRNFIKANSDLVGMSDEQLDALRVQTDFVNKVGGMGHVILEQKINDIPVFHGELLGAYTKDGKLFRVINNLASGLDYNSLSTNFGDPANAVRIAAENVSAEVDMKQNAAASTDSKAVFGEGYYPATATKYYFPIEPGIARAAWYVIVWKPVTGYEMLIDAETGKILWRTNMGKDQTQSVTYNVWSSTLNPNLSQDNPAPLTPGPIDPSSGMQGALLPRTMVTLIGNEAPNTFNNLGWITDGQNTTVGNNTNAGLDRATPNGPEPTTGSANRVFDFAINAPPGNPAPGEDPLPAGETPTPCDAAPLPQTPYQQASATQMFYVVNRLHDVLYRHGFTEQTRNFQTDNFGRGGLGGDAVFAEGQDCAGTNNANMASSTTDGTVARMQMFLWTNPTPDRDGTMDAEIILHEIGHGVTNRNHINGISGTQGGQMHEGNGDFQSHLLLSETTDPINAISTVGGYSTLNLRAAVPTANYYYGIRRFPKAVIAFTGGPLNRPHNPLTYADIDPAQHNVTNGAFAAAFTGSATAVHDGGEIWSSMLWEVRSRLVARLGHGPGTSKMLQLWLDGMRLTTSTTSMLNSRNALIAAAQASGTIADVQDVWAGFAARGLGFSATNPSGNTVTESFDPPGALIGTPITVSDSTGDGDGFPEPGEALLVSVPVQNFGTETANNVSVSVTGGGTVNYGNIAPGATVTNNIPYTVPAGAACGSTHTITVTGSSSTGPMTPKTTSFALGRLAAPTFTENFDGVTAPGLPAGWTAVPAPTLPLSINFVAVTTSADTAPNSIYANDPAAGASGTDLTSPAIAIPANGTALTFRHRFDTEPAWDGGLVEISINGGAFTDISLNGGSFVTNGYNSLMTAAAPSPTYVPNPLNGRNGWTGLSSGFITTTVNLPPAALGQNVRLKWRFGADDNTTGTGANPGWYVDTVSIASYECSVAPNVVRSRADFDGDGKTDFSVFRPSEGNWYLMRSTAGFGVLNWGVSTDTLVPGDYDNDGKTDTAVFRPTADPAAADFYILNSNGFTMSGYSWGVAGDIPVNRDYDNDGKVDIGVFRPSNNTWYIIKSTGGVTITAFGQAGDVPVPGDYDGDNKGDLVLYRSGTWVGQLSNGGTINTAHGAAGDLLVPADYDGDNKDDIAVFRPSTGTWMILKSTGGTQNTPWGASGDVPAPGDFDGDGKDDPAIYRNGTWWVLQSTAGAITFGFGVGSDTPVPSEYLP